jgi:hypothetical protein
VFGNSGNTTVQEGRLCTVPTKRVPCTVGTTVPLVQTMVQVRNKEELNMRLAALPVLVS